MADRELTEEEVADLKEAFAMFDINGDGKLFYSLNLGLVYNVWFPFRALKKSFYSRWHCYCLLILVIGPGNRYFDLCH